MKGHFIKKKKSGPSLAQIFFLYSKKIIKKISLFAGSAELRVLGKLYTRKVGIQIALMRLFGQNNIETSP